MRGFHQCLVERPAFPVRRVVLQQSFQKRQGTVAIATGLEGDRQVALVLRMPGIDCMGALESVTGAGPVFPARPGHAQVTPGIFVGGAKSHGEFQGPLGLGQVPEEK